MTDARRLKVCFVGLGNLPVLAREYNRHGVGGEELQQSLLAKAFARRGFDTSTIVFDLGQSDAAQWDGVTAYKAYSPHEGIPILRYAHPRWTKLWWAVKRAQADVYYCSCASIIPALLALYAKTRLPRPRLIFRIAHDRDCEPDALLIQYWRDRKLYEYGLRRMDVILAQSQRQQVAMKANYHRDSVVATMLVDASTRQYDFEQRDVPVLWVNNLRDFKRPDLALELARQLPDVSVHMIGGTQPRFEKLFEEIREQAKGVSNLTFHGPVPYHDVNDYYERARVFVNTSDTEGFPNSYLQAWQRGTPVVAFFDPDGVIAREGLGYVASDMGHMRQLVSSLVRDPEDWHTASLRCRAYMQREYSEDRIIAPYLRAATDSLPRGKGDAR